MKWFIVLVIVGYVIGQKLPPTSRDMPGKPENCHASADFLYRQCCVFPPFFTREVAKACGAMFSETFADPVNNITGLRRMAITGCNHWHCVLEKYDLLTAQEHLDHEKYYSHLDLWAELNPMFTGVLAKAKINCKNDYRYFFPLNPCEFFNFHGCIRNYVSVHCPVVRPTKECEELKAFYEACGEYFLKK